MQPGNRDDLDSLMTAALAGDPRSGARLFRALSALLTVYYTHRIGPGSPAIDDLVQETLMAIHQRRDSYDPHRPFRAWLFAVARHKLADHFRRRRDHLTLDECGDSLSIESFEGASNARLDIDRLLAALPDRQANLIRDRHLDGCSAAEAGQRWGVSEINVGVTVHRGLRVLGELARENVP